ncbi:probable membrane-associated kinase regulator 3 [Vicia villosa]|uniref:probable membrane-associated kinase regulator 3 n=1 Tax=Vicia villosa TaxID=3911 RepID=UPI00273AC962|nr:probable membrane-associated kinase regulator 3 [Vicia villosa]
MATKKAAFICIDEDYIDMFLSPYENLSPQQQNKDMSMPLHQLPYNSNSPFGFMSSQPLSFSSCDSNPSEYLLQCSTKSKKHWLKKLKHARKSSLIRKLNSYKAYLKSLFTKTALNKPKYNHFENAKRKLFQGFVGGNGVVNQNRRSSSSSYFSIDLNSEMEGLVLGAIAHCKQSQQGNGSKKDSHA